MDAGGNYNGYAHTTAERHPLISCVKQPDHKINMSQVFVTKGRQQADMQPCLVFNPGALHHKQCGKGRERGVQKGSCNKLTVNLQGEFFLIELLPSLWNSLPAALWRPEMTLHTFKRQLKAYLFHI